MTKDRFKKDEHNEVKERAMGICEVCKKQVRGGEFGHIIGQGKGNIKMFSEWFIHSAANGLWVCSTGLGFDCNKKADMGEFLEGRKDHILNVILYLEQLPHVPAFEFYDSVTKENYYVKKSGEKWERLL